MRKCSSFHCSALLFSFSYKTGEARWWVYYVLVSVAGMYTQIFMVLALLAQFLWVLLYHRNRLIAHGKWSHGFRVVSTLGPFSTMGTGFLSGCQPTWTGCRSAGWVTSCISGGVFIGEHPLHFLRLFVGLFTGPTVAELHENRSLGFILQFAPEILSVAVVFGALLLVGFPALYKLFGARSTIFCLLGLCLPILGTLLYALAPRATYNVRYTIVAFPYFCIFLGMGLTYVFQKYRPAGVVLFAGRRGNIFNVACQSFLQSALRQGGY